MPKQTSLWHLGTRKKRCENVSSRQHAIRAWRRLTTFLYTLACADSPAKYDNKYITVSGAYERVYSQLPHSQHLQCVEPVSRVSRNSYNVQFLKTLAKLESHAPFYFWLCTSHSRLSWTCVHRDEDWRHKEITFGDNASSRGTEILIRTTTQPLGSEDQTIENVWSKFHSPDSPYLAVNNWQPVRPPTAGCLQYTHRLVLICRAATRWVPLQNSLEAGEPTILHYAPARKLSVSKYTSTWSR